MAEERERGFAGVESLASEVDDIKEIADELCSREASRFEAPPAFQSGTPLSRFAFKVLRMALLAIFWLVAIGIVLFIAVSPLRPLLLLVIVWQVVSFFTKKR